ncbi:hypothetical protein ABTY98_05020 [Streptomyces sp. NPDC096040]|uniref:hypothetical protein n=1 Tax=Streptomyces sp. NPDC096040 TaxID=3155541 RepID=UPI00331B2871
MGGLYREYERIADHRQVAARAKAAPGQWQRVGQYRTVESARASATQVRAGAMTAYEPAGHFDAYRTVGHEGRGLWVRYVHGITPAADVPEQLPQAVAVVMTAHQTVDRYVSARWAVDLLVRRGYAEDADRIRAWLTGGRDGRTSARQAAAYLLQTSTIREDSAQ